MASQSLQAVSKTSLVRIGKEERREERTNASLLAGSVSSERVLATETVRNGSLLCKAESEVSTRGRRKKREWTNRRGT